MGNHSSFEIPFQLGGTVLVETRVLPLTEKGTWLFVPEMGESAHSSIRNSMPGVQDGSGSCLGAMVSIHLACVTPSLFAHKAAPRTAVNVADLEGQDGETLYLTPVPQL